MKHILGLLLCAACGSGVEPAREVSVPAPPTQSTPLVQPAPKPTEPALPSVTESVDQERFVDNSTGQLYRARMIAFFRRGFVVTGLGLPADEIKRLEAEVQIQVAADGTIKSYVIARPSGNTAFDAAVHTAMHAKVGQAIPPPPEDRPELQRSTLSFRMKCSSACQ